MVLKHVPKGDLIGSSVSCDYLVTAGVSNWGGFAVAAGLCILSGCPLFDRYNRNGIGYRTTTQCDDFMLTGEKVRNVNNFSFLLNFESLNIQLLNVVSSNLYPQNYLPFKGISKQCCVLISVIDAGNGRSVRGSLSPFLFALDQGGCALKWSTTPTSAPSKLTANISLPNLRYLFR